MAPRTRKSKRKQLAAVDPFGGFSLEQLLGLDPVVDVQRKPSLVARIIGLPVRLIIGLVKLPFRAVLLPVRVVASALSRIVRLPFRSR